MNGQYSRHMLADTLANPYVGQHRLVAAGEVKKIMSMRARPNTATRLIRKAKFYFSPYKVFTKEDRRFRLNWKQSLCLATLSVFGCWFMDTHGRFELARPVLAGLASIYMILQLRWHLRNRIWFWATLILFCTLFSVLTFTVKWSTEGASRGIVGGLMTISIYIVFVILHAFESRLKQPSAISTEPARHTALKD